MDFAEPIQRQLDGEVVRVSRLVELGFKSGVQRYWPGEFTLVAGGKGWRPTIGLGQITGLSQAIDGEAPELKLSLSGVDETFAEKALGSVDDYYGRVVSIYWQFFDEGWQPIGSLVPITWALMRSFVIDRKSTDQGFIRIATLTAETPFAGRARAPNGQLTDTDQKARHPKPVPDRMCERVAGLEARQIIWPRF